MDYAEYRQKRAAEIEAKRAEARRLEDAAKPPAPEPKAKKPSDWYWDSYFAGQFH